MRQNPSFTLASEDGVKRLVREHPWATIVSMTDASGLVASHYPVLLDEDADGIVLLTHVGRPDEVVHELGRHEVLVIVQGPHGYVSSGWYGPDPAVPTWNFTAAHLTGRPELLDPAENLRVLEALVDHFEQRLPEPRALRADPDDAAYAERLAAGTVGLRIPITRFVAKHKMSQNRPDATVDRIIGELEGDGPYASPALAAEMRRTHELLRAARAAAARHPGA
ncbi:FMN-binding negative transcriptional regulator [Agromyces tropicus]|uniref:FMN-binding negative transcriptional regulator n=1 Tax=Agromyces tropicus TaxID=555371 RepID=A0ABN2TY31_9MICO